MFKIKFCDEMILQKMNALYYNLLRGACAARTDKVAKSTRHFYFSFLKPIGIL